VKELKKRILDKYIDGKSVEDPLCCITAKMLPTLHIVDNDKWCKIV
jgi:hypothetical protein